MSHTGTFGSLDSLKARGKRTNPVTTLPLSLACGLSSESLRDSYEREGDLTGFNSERGI